MATTEVIAVYRETESPEDVAAQLAALRLLLAVAAKRKGEGE